MTIHIAEDNTTTPCDATGTFHNGAVGRWNAWFFTTFDPYINFISRHHKRHAFDSIEPGTIIEIGPGVGANFDFIPVGSRVIAVEPNEAMHDRLEQRAKSLGLELELIGAPAERLPLGNDSADTVICSLVLCTVESPDAALREVLRVLKPGGTFRFVEHVAAHPASPRRWTQVVLAKPWSWLYEGCQLCRRTQDTIARAGFTTVDAKHHRLRQSMFFPVNSAISGRAMK